MYLDKDKILETLAGYDNNGLLVFLRETLDEMEHAQVEAVFGELMYTEVIRQMEAEDVLDAVKTFYEDSLAGKYYAPFHVNGKNYHWIPPETDAWFNEMSLWLDRCCELAEAGYVEVAAHGLAYCLELIDLMNQGEEIVFAGPCSDWMITSRYDYEAVFYRVREMG